MADRMLSNSGGEDVDLPPPSGTRYKLSSEEELRLEVPFQKQSACTLTLQRGSCELWGSELALQRPVVLTEGGLKIALFTWHGCVLDVDCENVSVDIAYTSDETSCNVAFVNTHAQLEALRDSAALAFESRNGNKNSTTITSKLTTESDSQPLFSNTSSAASTSTNSNLDGPRVLICGPSECGKSTLAKILTAYACKLGRTPILVDLDPQDASLISVPGTIGACTMSMTSMSIDSWAQATGIPPGTSSPILFWHGQDIDHHSSSSSSMLMHGTDDAKLVSSLGAGVSSGSSSAATTSGGSGGGKTMPLSPELFRAQVHQLAHRIDQRLEGDDWARASGIIVNTNGWIEAEGFDLLLHAIRELRIHVVLVLGHDRLYSMVQSALSAASSSSKQQQQPQQNQTHSVDPSTSKPPVKVIKLPRSGGVVSRGADYVRRLRNRSIKQYFYGCLVDRPSSAAGSGAETASPSSRVPQLTPFLLQIPMGEVTIYRFSSVRLSASLLPVAAAQTSEAIQLVPVLQNGKLVDIFSSLDDRDDTERAKQFLQHHVLAVCHRHTVQAYEASGKASDLYLAGVAGFCTVERIVMDKLHLLSPCAGSLPSNVLLMGNIMWME